VVVDTNVLVAGISGCKGAYVPAKYPSADVLFRWADRENFIWLVTEEILSIITLNTKDFPKDRLQAEVLTPAEFLAQHP
jgi:hypothetical protein